MTDIPCKDKLHRRSTNVRGACKKDRLQRIEVARVYH
jgi:hypothetical protein